MFLVFLSIIALVTLVILAGLYLSYEMPEPGKASSKREKGLQIEIQIVIPKKLQTEADILEIENLTKGFAESLIEDKLGSK